MEDAEAKTAKEAKDGSVAYSALQEQFENCLSNVNSTPENSQTLIKKVADLEKTNKKLNSCLKMHEKRFETLLREKDNLQKEHNKNVLMRTKLEQVCREQQKLLKSVQSESIKHKETQAKFQVSINEISSTLHKNNEENIKLKEDNIEMTKKLKYLAEQYQIREKQLEKINEQVQLENQLHDAKLAKVKMEATMEKEILLKEKQNALDELLKSKKSLQEMQKREELLKEQLALYTSKYDDFQSSLQKSNDIFTTYKTELESMVKKTKKLEKESSEWKRKCEKSTASVLDLATEKQVRDEYIAKNSRQMQQLQKLLRTLQAERTVLYKTLKDNNIETPPMPALPPEPEPVPLPQLPQTKQPDKIETMAKNCAELKQSLALLQDQMQALSTKQAPVADHQPNETSSRSKNKKGKSRNKACPTGKDKSTCDLESRSKRVNSNETESSKPADDVKCEDAEVAGARVVEQTSPVNENTENTESLQVSAETHETNESLRTVDAETEPPKSDIDLTDQPPPPPLQATSNELVDQPGEIEHETNPEGGPQNISNNEIV